ncbi:MAG: carbohydrate ABC transporter permease [Aristaeellaceae bacterium]
MKAPREHWYDGIVDAVKIYIPGNSTFKTMRARNARTGTWFILPFIIGFLLFMCLPMAESFFFSFNDVKLIPGKGYEPTWVGLNNYKHALLVDPEYNTLLVEETMQMIVNTIATLVLSFVVAVILNQEFKGRLLCRAIFFLPVILSSGVLPGIEHQNEFYDMMAGMAEAVEGSSGVNISQSLQNLLSVSGMGGKFFDLVFEMIDSIYDIVMASGIQIIVFLSGLQSISPSLYEAADVEGCSAWESFWKITFPMVSPLLLVNCIYTIIDFFMKNDNKVMELIYQVTYQDFKFGVSAAMSWLYFAIALAFIGISSFIISKAVKSYE